jgi:hypothetical protein
MSIWFFLFDPWHKISNLPAVLEIRLNPRLSPKNGFGQGNCGASRQIMLKKAQGVDVLTVV